MNSCEETTANAEITAERSDHWPRRIKIGVVLFAIFWLVLMGATWTQAHADEAAPRDDDEYNFKWLDPEKKIYVLQNRRYTKANRLLLSVLGGAGFSNPYRNTLTLEPRAAYYFTESWGFEVFYNKTFNRENSTYKALTSTNTQVFPIIREIRSELGALVHWVPWYAKINVFNQILYFDWYFSGGLGTVQSAVTSGTTAASLNDFRTEDKFATYLGTGHQYHLGESFTVRLDFMGTFYKAPLGGTTGENVWFTNYNFGIGLGMRF